MTGIRHIALSVPDLPAAEAYYRQMFQMQLIGREAQLEDGLWYTLPFDKSWADAEAAGIKMGMSALRNGAFVLALFQGDAPQGQVFAIGLNLPQEEMARVRSHLPDDVQLFEDSASGLSFRDAYQIGWQISIPGNEFRTAGDLFDRWLPV